MSRLRRLVMIGSAATLAMLIIFSAQPALATSWTVTAVVTGLALPRGIAFDGLGAMYVAESGLPGPLAQGLTRGAVDKYVLARSVQRVWSTSFTSAYARPLGPAEVLGRQESAQWEAAASGRAPAPGTAVRF
jgi:hypothetical protein